MADTEFEELRRFFEQLPQHKKVSSQNYTLVHDVTPDELQNLNDSYDYADENVNLLPDENEETDCDDPLTPPKNIKYDHLFLEKCNCNSNINKRYERKGQKSSQIKSNKSDFESNLKSNSELSLFNELNQMKYNVTHHGIEHTRIIDDDYYSLDSEFFDSGNSTTYSPDDSLLIAETSDSSADESFQRIELLEATHRALYRFIARHSDELDLEIGDPIYVQKEAEDLWCEGINLQNGNHGIFPSAYVVDVDYNDFESHTQIKKERFLLTYLGSIETLYHKGNDVLCRAVQKITSSEHRLQSCILEVSDQGLKMYDRFKVENNSPSLNYFYSLKNVSFCGFYLHDSRFMGFITKHPQCNKFACHVFQGEECTRPITESIGKAFQRFYQKYIETAYPVEDIYIE